MQSPPRRTAKDLFLHVVDEADIIITHGDFMSSRISELE